MAILFSIAMQIASLIPHHHHEGNPAACYDISHCYHKKVSHNHGAGGDCTGHDDAMPSHQHDSPTEPCTLSEMTDLPGTIENSRQPVAVVQSPLFLTHEAVSCDECSQERFTVISNIRAKDPPRIKPLHIYVITRTLPLRAPSFEA